MNEMTQLIAMIAGPYLLVTGLGFLFSREFYVEMIAGAPKSDPVLINLSGAVHFLVGMMILTRHWVWSSGEEIAVSLLGVAAVLKGGSMIAMPMQTLKSPKSSGKILSFIAIAFIVIGAYFIKIGYWE